MCLLLQVSCKCHEVFHAAVRGAQGKRDVQTPHSNLHQDDVRGDPSLPHTLFLFLSLSLSLSGLCYLHLQLKLLLWLLQESDLHTAVCLEQAAHAFLRIHPSMARKYALHLILAGHRFAKATQVSRSTH